MLYQIYYGEVTGAESAETGAAIRRFQIRNGISVSGKLNAETLAALGLGVKKSVAVAPQPPPLKAAQPAPQAAVAAVAPAQKQLNPPPPEQTPAPARGEQRLPMKRTGDLLVGTEPRDTAHEPSRRVNSADPAVVEPPTPIPAPVSTPFSTMFRDTPYATAPRDVQVSVIRRAQAVMATQRFYRGPFDGIERVRTLSQHDLFQSLATFERDAAEGGREFQPCCLHV